MNVLFIDIDGVLNTCSPLSANEVWKNAERTELNIDEDKVCLIAQIVQSAEIKLVMHSGWRFFYDDLMNPMTQEAEELRRMFCRNGVIISGRTPDYSTEEIRQNRKFSLVKAREIRAWLAQHPECENFLILDDMDLHDTDLMKHQIQTDPALGLTECDVERAIMYLSKGNEQINPYCKR